MLGDTYNAQKNASIIYLGLLVSKLQIAEILSPKKSNPDFSDLTETSA